MTSKQTHHFQPSPTQYPLRSRRNTTPIPLQIPHNISSVQLWEHLRYLLDLSWVHGMTARASTATSGARLIVALEEPSDHEKGHDSQGQERGYVERGLLFRHRLERFVRHMLQRVLSPVDLDEASSIGSETRVEIE